VYTFVVKVVVTGWWRHKQVPVLLEERISVPLYPERWKVIRLTQGIHIDRDDGEM
jgi:hypothetical protein